MSLFEILLLSLALCVDSLVVSTASSFKSGMNYRRGLLMAVVFAFFQGLFPLLGALLGSAFRDMIAAVDHWVAFGLLSVVGGKMIYDALSGVSEDRKLDVSRFGVLCLLGVATSIDAFVVGIGLGLDNDMPRVFFIVFIIGLVTFAVSMLGVFLGKRNVPVPERVAGIIAGIVLIGLGTYTLIEHLTNC